MSAPLMLRPGDDIWAIGRRHGSGRRLLVRPRVLFPVLLFLLSLTVNLAHVDVTEFHPDETRWLNRAHYFTDLADPFGPTWEDQYLTRGQPPLGSYLMGLGLLLQGRDTATNGVWDFTYGVEWNTISGAMPDPADLDAGRRTNAVVGAITVVLAYLIAATLAGTVAASATGLLLALHPLHIWIASQALSDQLLILIVASALLTIIRLAERPSRGKALLLGILLGLGGATKLSPLLLSLPLAVYGVGLVVLARRGLVDRDKAYALGPLLFVQPVIAAVTFVVSYPYLWPRPIERTWNLFQLRTQEMREQAAAWPNIEIANPGEALLRVYDRLTWQFSTSGNLSESVLGLVGIDASVWGFEIPLAIIGAGVLVWLVWQRGLTSGTALAAFLLAGQVGAIIVGMKVDFYRYHLPLVLGVTILCGFGFQMIWQLLADHGAIALWNVIPGVSVAPVPGKAIQPRPTVQEDDGSTDPSINRPIRSGTP